MVFREVCDWVALDWVAPNSFFEKDAALLQQLACFGEVAGLEKQSAQVYIHVGQIAVSFAFVWIYFTYFALSPCAHGS